MGAAVVAAGYKDGFFSGDSSESLYGAFKAADPGGIGIGSGNQIVIVHDVQAFKAKALFDEFFFGLPVVDQQDIGVAPFRQADGLTGADGDYPDRDTAVGFKYGRR